MRVPATGVCDKKLSLLNTSVVVVRVRFCKYPHLAHFAPIVCKCDTARINSQCYFVYKVERCCCVPMTRLYLTSRQVTCVDIQYHAEHPLVKYTSRGNSITMTRQTFSKSYRFANICQTNQSWVQHDKYWRGSVYGAHVLAHLSNTRVVGTWRKDDVTKRL